MAVAGGFALAWMVVPIVGKRVFLRVVSTIPTVMRGMTPSVSTVQKAAFGRSKSPAFAGTKTAANRGPSPNPPQGAGIHSRCALVGYDCAPFLEKDWNMNIIWAFFLPFGKG